MIQSPSGADLQAQPRAAVFDLDGVVTFTGAVHQAAWTALFDEYLRDRAARGGEPYRPFTAEDFHVFVDGRPRYDGVRTFLASRGIALPEGRPDDPPERETICGVGNRKNVLFTRQLREQGVAVDEAAVRFIRALRAAGVAVGMASSSRNATAVLERAGLLDLFDARVDGLVSASERLQGKPAPDIFLRCLELLGRLPARDAVMVEDATVGVAAGRAGGFGLVLGVDRGGNWLRLREQGADWIIRDFAEVSPEGVAAYFSARRHVRPSALAEWPAIAETLAGRRVALFLDYDGTLTSIADRPELAVLSGAMRERLEAVARAWPTMIVTGRGLADVRGLVKADGLIYAASHGFDVAGPEGSNLRLEVDPAIGPEVAAAVDQLRAATADVPGVLVENKTYSAAVHYRLAPPERVPDVERLVDEALAGRARLRKATGKMVFELRPARAWDKGRAVLWLLETLELNGADVLPIFIGDDTTDEDAFRALGDRGLGIVVMELPRPSAARYALQTVEEVGLLLDRLTRLRGGT